MAIPNLATTLVADLKIIPSNCVSNNETISDGTNTIQGVRGFVGVQSISSNVLNVGIAWGNSQALKSIVVQITLMPPNTVSIAYLETPVGMHSSQVDAMIDDFLASMDLKVQIKKKNLQKKKKPGGKYTGRRMEARNRSKAPPTCHFATVVNVLFTPIFIGTAKPLTIIYK